MALKKFVATALVGLALLFATAAEAADATQPPAVKWTTPMASPITKEVKAACEAKDAENLAFCYGTLMALYDASFFISDAFNAPELCIPKDTTAAQMRDKFLDMTKRRPDQLIGPIGIFYYMAMDDEFPCQKAAPAKSAKSKK